ncbi:MAG: hypothetical protein WBD47_21180, partial [Phormidesmis sp.]
DLWHPLYLAVPQASSTAEPVENPPDPPVSSAGGVRASAEGAPLTPFPSSLLEHNDCNPLPDNTSSSLVSSESGGADGVGRNSDIHLLSNEAFAPPPRQLILDIQQMLQDTREKQKTQRLRRQADSEDGQRAQQNSGQADRIAQLYNWATSDDPILKAEALQQLRRMGLDDS